MIQLQRTSITTELQQSLTQLTESITARPGPTRVTTARTLWRNRRSVRAQVHEALTDSAAGRQRCMYCGDNEGTDIDHYNPVARAPHLTFVWPNHLLACATCNSHHKRDRFPLSPRGTPLLLDPTQDDPFDHLALSLTVGSYLGLTERGNATIELCSLNRDILTRGRQVAYDVSGTLLTSWQRAIAEGDEGGSAALVRAIREQPFADVVHAMFRYCDAPGAEEIFSGRSHLLPILWSPELPRELLIRPKRSTRPVTGS